MILLNNVNANTTGVAQRSAGGKFIAIARADNYGTSGQMEIQVASANDPNDPTFRWLTLTNGIFTADNTVNLDYLPVGLLIRGVATNVPGDGNFFLEILS